MKLWKPLNYDKSVIIYFVYWDNMYKKQFGVNVAEVLNFWFFLRFKKLRLSCDLYWLVEVSFFLGKVLFELFFQKKTGEAEISFFFPSEKRKHGLWGGVLVKVKNSKFFIKLFFE